MPKLFQKDIPTQKFSSHSSILPIDQNTDFIPVIMYIGKLSYG